VSNLQSPVEAVRETNREFGKDFFDWIQKTLASQTKLGVASGPVQGLEISSRALDGRRNHSFRRAWWIALGVSREEIQPRWVFGYTHSPKN